MWKDFFYYSRSEQRGIVVLVVVLVLVIGVRIALPFMFDSPVLSEEQKAFLIKGKAINDSISKCETKSNSVASLNGVVPENNLEKEVVDTPLVWINFNSVDSSFWNLNINDSCFRDSITVFLEKYKCLKSLPLRKVKQYSDGQLFRWIKKNSCLKKQELLVEKIDLNMADTVQLKRISGIGSVLSKRIIKYRNLLGGYVSKEQLKEVYGISLELYGRVKDDFSVSDGNVRRFNLHKDKISEISRHPYFKYEQVVELVNLSRKNKLKTDHKVSGFNSISEAQWAKMKQYLIFD